MRRSTATTEYLKECMGTALLELMKEKPMEKISIEEMTAKADVGRSTYFRWMSAAPPISVTSKQRTKFWYSKYYAYGTAFQKRVILPVTRRI